jgi:SAM-dependent methyltransferase
VRLNAVGRLTMNNPARRAVHRHVLLPMLTRLAGRPLAGAVLELGPGEGDALLALGGVGVELDPVMAARAKHRGAGVVVGDAVHLPVRDCAVDVVLDLGALHLVPDWRAALAEVRRVLRPGGVYAFEHIVGSTFRGVLPISTAGFANPNRTGFGERSFLGECDALGWTAAVERPARGWLLTGLVGDLVGVAV